ncbi:MAG: nucleoside triphosphate pyrophosphatase [Marinagarivorans sp.]|nr:nucleoside triphosphate pyrophosphatase [Marinagarivorans sp.]
MTKTLLLASQSPRRAELLAQIGVPFEVVRIDVPEQRGEAELPQDYVQRLAQDKAREGARLYPSAVVLGADTLVECQGQVLEKPRNADHAQAMLALLSGRTHQVHTAVAVCKANELHSVLVTSAVTFRVITDDEAARYWATGEPCDKAGGYGIQGFGGVFVEHLEGSYSAVMGLPVAQTQQLLSQLGLPYWQAPETL